MAAAGVAWPGLACQPPLLHAEGLPWQLAYACMHVQCHGAAVHLLSVFTGRSGCRGGAVHLLSVFTGRSGRRVHFVEFEGLTYELKMEANSKGCCGMDEEAALT